MATINKKLIHFRSLSDFEARLAAGDVLSTSIVWIKDAKKIWTHGEYYDCNGGGGGSYVPMSNTLYDSPSSVTIAPNSSVEVSDLGLTSIAISLTEPTDNRVVNTYTLIIRKFGCGNAFTFDKTIIWANDNAPVFDTSARDEFVEISIKRTLEGYYLGTWAKFSIS